MGDQKLWAAILSLAFAGSGLAAELGTGRPPLALIEAAPTAAPIFVFADTQISYRYVFTAAEPGVPSVKSANPSDGRDIPKHVLNISHADAWPYGTNFVSLDILKSGSQDPSGTRN